MILGRRPLAQTSLGESDELAAAALQFLDGLYRSAVRLTRDSDQAQDFVQDTYLKAIRGRDRFARGTNLKAWLDTILNNTWRNRRRDEGRARVDYRDSAAGNRQPATESQ